MAKKIDEVLDKAEEKIEEKTPSISTPISPLTSEFSRTDLNQMRDKINEIIERMGS